MKVSRVVSDEMYEEDMEANMRSKKRKNEKEKNLTMLELPQQYKQVTKRLLNMGKLEMLLFLRILMETGIRPTDVRQIKPVDIRDRKVFTLDRKRRAEPYYLNNGRLPRISKQTERIAQILVKRQGCFFTETSEHYLRQIRYVWEQPEFSIHLLRKYRVKEICYERRIV